MLVYLHKVNNMKKKLLVIFITVVCLIVIGGVVYRSIVQSLYYNTAKEAFERTKPFGASLVDIIEYGDYALIDYKELFSKKHIIRYTYKTDNGYTAIKTALPKLSKIVGDSSLDVLALDGNLLFLFMSKSGYNETTVNDSLGNEFVLKTYGSGQGFDIYATIGFAAQKRDELPTNYSITINGTEYKVFE